MLSKFVALLIASTAASPVLAASQPELDSLAARMGVRMTIVDNKPANCPAQASGCFLSRLDLKMPGKLPADLSNFAIYFSSVSPVIQADSDTFNVRLINGDLHVIELKPDAKIEAGKTYPIQLWRPGHNFSAFYTIPNMFIVSGQLTPRIIAATRPVFDRESRLEELPFVAPLRDEAHLATASADDETVWQTPERAFATYADRNAAVAAPSISIIPTPMLAQQLGGPPIDLTKGVRLSVTGIERSSLDAALADLATAGVRTGNGGPALRIRVLAAGLKPEAYRLTARDGAIDIEAADFGGAVHALESLAQQARFDRGSLRPLRIEDSPRAPFRGLHIDLARNFHSKAEVLKLVEQMGRYKLNKLHLHLGDDEGWRLQIAKLPELTEVGAYRCYDPSETHCLLPQLGAGPDRNTAVNGFLTRADYIDILKAAHARGIEVIPSFDMPGHSRAAIKSMEARYRRLMAAGRAKEAEEFRLAEPGDTTQYRSVQNYNDNTLNVCLESTYHFLDAVIDELKAMHAAAGVPLKTYHIGADETAGAWSQSPACQTLMAKSGRKVNQLGSMFIERVSRDLASKGIEVAGWSDGLGHADAAQMPRGVQSDIWGDLFTAATAEAHKSANQGWKTVVAVPNVLYLDVPYAPHPLERGYDWPTRGTDTFKVFSFMPENLPANAAVMKDIRNKTTTMSDTQPLAAGRVLDGSQANLWSETVRADSIVDYMFFPRVIAFAERAWHRGSWEPAYRAGASYTYADAKVDAPQLKSDWSGFAGRLAEQLKTLETSGILYRLAPPGARMTSGQLEANSELPGQPIEYRINGGAWQAYHGPVRVSGKVELRTRSFDNRRTSRVVELGGV